MESTFLSPIILAYSIANTKPYAISIPATRITGSPISTTTAKAGDFDSHHKNLAVSVPFVGAGRAHVPTNPM
jgi:hypothetical protein